MTPGTRPADRRRPGWAHALLLGGLLTVGTAGVLSLPLVIPQPATVAMRSVAEGALTGTTDAPALAPMAIGGPAVTGLEFPALGGEQAPVSPVGVSPEGALGIPDDPNQLGWWDGGAAPSARTGTVVIDGHLDSDRYGLGFFVNLRRLKPGDPVALTDAAGNRSQWTVSEVGEYPAANLSDTGVFDQNATPRLALITCGGPFDRAAHVYRDNLVVYAVPAGGPNDLD
jgi:hypothetical protein